MNKAEKNIGSISSCYGCGVCVSVCPQKIIDMKLSDEGFLNPVITEPQFCSNCGLCLKVCSFVADIPADNKKKQIAAYSGYSKDAEILRTSTSGGIGFEIGSLLIGNGYKAAAVRYNAPLQRAEHFIASTVDEFKASQGSKYLQSYTSDSFNSLNKKDKWVVFGTPCQIDSLRRMIRLRGWESNYVLVDFFCHGVPSYLLLHNYLQEQTRVESFDELPHVYFRDKSRGWHGNIMRLETKNKTKIHPIKRRNLFAELYYSCTCLNTACYSNCKYKPYSSSADIRIGDFWGKKYLKNNQGVSAMLALTDTGKGIISSINEKCVIHNEDLNEIINGQMKRTHKQSRFRSAILRSLKDGNVSLDSFMISLILTLVKTKKRIINLPNKIKTTFSL